MALFHSLAGAVFCIGWFIFFDGLVFAGRTEDKYHFAMWLPGILCLVMFFMLFFADVTALGYNQNDDSMFGSSVDSSELTKARVIFFVAAVFGLGALSIAIWKMAETYNKPDNSWPGVALLLQSFMLMVSAGLNFYARQKEVNAQSEGNMF